MYGPLNVKLPIPYLPNLRDVDDKQRLGRPHTSTADDNVCRADAHIKEGRHIKLADLAREPDILPGVIHRPRTRHFARYYPSKSALH